MSMTRVAPCICCVFRVIYPGKVVLPAKVPLPCLLLVRRPIEKGEQTSSYWKGDYHPQTGPKRQSPVFPVLLVVRSVSSRVVLNPSAQFSLIRLVTLSLVAPICRYVDYVTKTDF